LLFQVEHATSARVRDLEKQLDAERKRADVSNPPAPPSADHMPPAFAQHQAHCVQDDSPMQLCWLSVHQVVRMALPQWPCDRYSRCRRLVSY
jgi:hypothetical protein